MKEQSTSKGFAILSAANMAVKLLSFLYLPFLLKILKGEGYGIYSAAYQVYVFIYVITNSGIPSAISKIVSECSALNNHRDALRSFKLARFILLVAGIVMSLLLFLLAGPLTKVLHYEKSYLAILALAPSIFLTSLASAYRGYFQGKSNMIPTAVSQVVEQLVNTVFTLVLAALFIKRNVQEACAGGAAATTLAALFSLIILIVYYQKYSRTKPAQLKNEGTSLPGNKLLKRILHYSIPITLCIGLQYAGNLIDLGNTKARLLVAGFSDAMATEMYGYLAKFQQLVNVPISIVAALTAVIMPAVASAVALKDQELLKSKSNYAFRLCFIITVPSAVGLAVLSRPVYELLKFQPGSYLMAYGSVIIILMAVLLLQTTILQGAGRFNTVTTNAVLGIAVKITCNYFLIAIPEININGALFGTILGYLVSIILNNIAIRRYLKINSELLRLSAKPIAASCIQAVTAYFLYFLAERLFNISESYFSNAVFTFSAILLCLPVYFGTLMLFGGINIDDLSFLPGPVLKLLPAALKKKGTDNSYYR